MEKLLAIKINDGQYTINPPKDVPGGGPETLNKILQAGLTLLFVGLTILVLFYLIWGGLQWVMSEGDKTKVQAARNKIIYAIIGLVVAFLAFFIVSLVGAVVGVELIKTPSPRPPVIPVPTEPCSNTQLRRCPPTPRICEPGKAC